MHRLIVIAHLLNLSYGMQGLFSGASQKKTHSQSFTMEKVAWNVGKCCYSLFVLRSLTTVIASVHSVTVPPESNVSVKG